MSQWENIVIRHSINRDEARTSYDNSRKIGLSNPWRVENARYLINAERGGSMEKLEIIPGL